MIRRDGYTKQNSISSSKVHCIAVAPLQTSTVIAYQEAFEKLSHRVDGLPKNFLIGCFVAGLKDEIRLDVKVKKPSTLSDTIGLGSPFSSTPVRRITGQEAKERREKGLCYYCNEKFIPDHSCQRPQFFMIEDCPL
ncbi:hypothetical protein ACOSQ2_022217 [Xanthoceras sorbifolium]